MLTLKEAWLRMAELWDNPRESYYGPTVFDCCQGLCTTIEELVKKKELSVDDSLLMYDIIAELPTLYIGSYKWLRNLEGARQRAAFCREQAAKLEKTTLKGDLC